MVKEALRVDLTSEINVLSECCVMLVACGIAHVSLACGVIMLRQHGTHSGAE